MAQWAYNTSVHSATGMTPYEVMFGVAPRQAMEFVVKAGTRVPPSTALFAELQRSVLAMARDALFHAQQAMLKYENRGRLEAEFAVGEHVFLSTVNLGNSHFDTTVRKLRPAYCGPYLITGREGKYNYQLSLPVEMRALHPVFHASLLWRAVPTPEDMEGRLGPGVSYPVVAAAVPVAVPAAPARVAEAARLATPVAASEHVAVLAREGGPVAVPTAGASVRAGPNAASAPAAAPRRRRQAARAVAPVAAGVHVAVPMRAELPVATSVRVAAPVTATPVAASSSAAPVALPKEGPGLLTHDDDGVPVFVMEKVLSRRRSGTGWEYLIQWDGYPQEEASYVTKKDMETEGALRFLRDFDATQPSKGAAKRA